MPHHRHFDGEPAAGAVSKAPGGLRHSSARIDLGVSTQRIPDADRGNRMYSLGDCECGITSGGASF